MSKKEWIDNIISQLYESGGCQLIGNGKEFDLAKKELLNRLIIKRGDFGYWNKLTPLGYEIAESGLSYEDFFRPAEKPGYHHISPTSQPDKTPLIFKIWNVIVKAHLKIRPFLIRKQPMA